MLEITREYILSLFPSHKFLGPVHRLDAAASGVLLFAKTPKAASRLSRTFRREDNNVLHKKYFAVVEGHFPSSAGDMVHILKIRKDKHVASKVKISLYNEPQNKFINEREACLKYSVAGQSPFNSLLEIDLISGRRHQIRVQLSHEGHPIVGDYLYGAGSCPHSSTTFEMHGAIALHHSVLTITHPVSNEVIVLKAPPPALWYSAFGPELVNMANHLLRTADPFEMPSS
jgi:23S rRNA pseudouridine1911/1915/1917 synthase